MKGLRTLRGNPLSTHFDDNLDLAGLGTLVTLTPERERNSGVKARLCPYGDVQGQIRGGSTLTYDPERKAWGPPSRRPYLLWDVAPPVRSHDLFAERPEEATLAALGPPPCTERGHFCGGPPGTGFSGFARPEERGPFCGGAAGRPRAGRPPVADFSGFGPDLLLAAL